MPAKIIIAGEGGQGVQTIAKILSKTAQKSGKKVSYLPSFGVEQRGGVTLSFIQLSDREISYPRFSKANIILAMCGRAIPVVKQYVNDNTLFIYDRAEISNKSLEKIKNEVKNFIAIDAKKIASEKFSTKVTNMILLGVLSNQFKDISFTSFQNGITDELQNKITKDSTLKDLNFNAFREGVNLAESYDFNNEKFEGKQDTELVNEFENTERKWTRFPQYCKGCLLCVVVCPVKAITLSSDLNFLGNPMPKVDIDKCIGCGKCQNICPDAAIKVEKKT